MWREIRVNASPFSPSDLLPHTMDIPASRSYSLPSPASPSSTSSSTSITKKRSSKSHVPTACVNCKKAHLACDLSRPCKRCVSMGKTDSCYDIQHKKRGRPKLRDKRTTTWKHDKVEKQRTINNSSTGVAAMSMAVAPALAPGLANSSFTMTQPPGYQEPKEQVDSMMTIFLSMDMRCARVSDEVLEFLGLYPQQLAHRSLYDFLVSTDSLENVHRCLTDNNRPASKFTTTSEHFVNVPPSKLLSIANGSQTFKETLHFKRPNASYCEPLDARFYLGGGLGADLFVPSSLDRLYIVCLLTVQQAGNEPLVMYDSTAAAAVRPITPKQQQQQLQSQSLSQDELSAVALTDPQHAFHWTSPSPPMENLENFRLCDTTTSTSSNSTITTSNSTTMTDRWSSDDETHQLVWMQPHDLVYAPPQQQKPTTLEYSKFPTTTTAPFSMPWQSDMSSILVPTDYDNIMRDIK